MYIVYSSGQNTGESGPLLQLTQWCGPRETCWRVLWGSLGKYQGPSHRRKDVGCIAGCLSSAALRVAPLYSSFSLSSVPTEAWLLASLS